MKCIDGAVDGDQGSVVRRGDPSTQSLVPRDRTLFLFFSCHEILIRPSFSDHSLPDSRHTLRETDRGGKANIFSSSASVINRRESSNHHFSSVNEGRAGSRAMRNTSRLCEVKRYSMKWDEMQYQDISSRNLALK